MKNRLNIEVLLFRMYIVIMILEGPIRYVLNLVNLVTLIYVKDCILIMLFVLAIINNKKITKVHIWILIVVLIILLIL